MGGIGGEDVDCFGSYIERTALTAMLRTHSRRAGMEWESSEKATASAEGGVKGAPVECPQCRRGRWSGADAL